MPTEHDSVIGSETSLKIEGQKQVTNSEDEWERNDEKMRVNWKPSETTQILYTDFREGA